MPSLALAFDILARDRNASATFNKVGDSAAKAGDKGKRFGSLMKGAAAVAGGALAAAGIGELISGTTDALRDSIAEARESEKVGKTTAQIIKATGGAAKISADQVGNLATAISNKSGIDDEAIQSGANLLLTFKQVRNEVGKGNDVFNRATQAATDLSAAGFGDINGASKMLGKALNDPLKGLTALGRAGVTFTEGQKKQIATLVKSGKTLEAQKVILGEVEHQVGGVAAANATMGEKLKTSFANFKEQIGTALLPVIDKVEKVLVEKVIPGVSQFFTEMQNGTGKGGAFVAFLKDVANAAQNVVHWIKDDLWPALQAGYQTILPALKQAFSIISGAFSSGGKDGKGFGDTLKSVSGFITGTLIPVIATVAKYYLPFWATQIRVVVEAVKILWGVFKTLLGIVGSVISFILRRFADLSGMWANVLRALSKVPGFGWAKDAADKLDHASGKANALASSIERIPNRKNVDVTISLHEQMVRVASAGNLHGNIPKNATGTRNFRGGLSWVGEQGPELVYVPKGANIYSHPESRAMARSGATVAAGGGGPLVAVYPQPGQSEYEIGVAAANIAAFRRNSR